MTNKVSIRAGDPCWFDLMTTDLQAAVSFYTDVLGFTYRTESTPEFNDYVMFSADHEDGVSTAGAFALTDEMKANNIPPHWNAYIRVDDAAEMTDKAKGLGATVLQGPFQVGDHGFMSVLLDPTGAAIHLWQSKDPSIQQVDKDTVGAVGWIELRTRDIEKSKAFYTGLFGWEVQVDEMPNKTYYSFINHGRPGMGMFLIGDDMPASVPSHWALYFTVDDFDAALEKCQSLKAQTLYDPRDVPGVGKFVTLTDPQGAPFSIIEYAADKES